MKISNESFQHSFQIFKIESPVRNEFPLLFSIPIMVVETLLKKELYFDGTLFPLHDEILHSVIKCELNSLWSHWEESRSLCSA